VIPLLLMACSGVNPVEETGVRVDITLRSTNTYGGGFELRTAFDDGTDVTWETPKVEGLELFADGDARREDLGPRDVVAQIYRFSGPEGSHVIGPVEVDWTLGDQAGTAISNRLFIDLGGPGGAPEAFADIEEPGLVWTNFVPWRWVFFAGAWVGLLSSAVVGGLVIIGRRKAAPVVMEAAHVVAIRRWEAVRGDQELSDHDKAVAISHIYREYAESVLAFPALSWTTSQILERLGAMTHLPEGNLVRAKRLLRATDMVKFAEQHPDGDFFVELDADLRAFVLATRPRSWEGT
jgi:hypothetical protein